MKDLRSSGLCLMSGRGRAFFLVLLILPNGLGLGWRSKGATKLDLSDKVNLMYSHFFRVKTHSGTAQKAAVVVVPLRNLTHDEVCNAQNMAPCAFLFKTKRAKTNFCSKLTISFTLGFSEKVSKRAFSSPPKLFMFLIVNCKEKKQIREGKRKHFRLYRCVFSSSFLTGKFLQKQTKQRASKNAASTVVYLFYICHNLSYCLICLCYILSLNCDFLLSVRFSILLKLRNNSCFFQASLVETFLYKSQSRKRSFSLSCSLPKIQTSSQKTTHHTLLIQQVSVHLDRRF